MTQAHTSSWIHSLIPSSASWAVIATELAALFFIAAVVFGWFALRGRKQRINAAKALLKERDRIADSVTDTMAMHLKALLSGREPSEEDLDDYHERSRELIGRFCQPWLEPSKSSLSDAVNAVLALRHTDLHQLAGLLGGAQKPSGEEVAAMSELRQSLEESKHAEALRSKQLQEALTTIGTMVAEYGRKYDAAVDHRAGQVLRALIYLQAIDEGHDAVKAKEIVDEMLNEDLEVLNQTAVPSGAPTVKSAKPAAEAVAAAAAAEAASLSHELDSEAKATPEPTSPTSEQPLEDTTKASTDFADEILADIDEVSAKAEVEPAVPDSTPQAQAVRDEAPDTEPEVTSPSGDMNFEDLDDIDALISQAQSVIDSQGKPTPESSTAAAADNAEIEADHEQPPAQAETGKVDRMPSSATPEALASEVDKDETQQNTQTIDAETLEAETAETGGDAIKIDGTQDAEEDFGESEIVDLDAVELPSPSEPEIDDNASESATGDANTASDNADLDLDNIDALLDAEIARHQSATSSGEMNEDDLDLSK